MLQDALGAAEAGWFIEAGGRSLVGTKILDYCVLIEWVENGDRLNAGAEEIAGCFGDATSQGSAGAGQIGISKFTKGD